MPTPGQLAISHFDRVARSAVAYCKFLCRSLCVNDTRAVSVGSESGFPRRAEGRSLGGVIRLCEEPWPDLVRRTSDGESQQHLAPRDDGHDQCGDDGNGRQERVRRANRRDDAPSRWCRDPFLGHAFDLRHLLQLSLADHPQSLGPQRLRGRHLSPCREHRADHAGGLLVAGRLQRGPSPRRSYAAGSDPVTAPARLWRAGLFQW